MAGDMAMPDRTMGSMSGMPATGMAAMSFGAFIVAWIAMMTAMMFPAISPVVRLYARAATAGRVAPLPFFVSGYLVVWSAVGVPAYVAWRALNEPLAMNASWTARTAGVVLIVAAAWQLTPLKSICLHHCRSPMSVFLHAGGRPERPLGAARLGGTHGAYCLGCCWALMAVLVAMGTMNLWWMVGLSVIILVEKVAPGGDRIASATAAVMAALGVWLLIDPSLLSVIT